MPISESTYKFDNGSTAEHLIDRPLDLESRLIPSEQWNHFDYADPSVDGFDGFDKIWNTLSQPIGICLVSFSELEDALEFNLHERISDRSDQLGLIITRQMSYIQKVNLYIDVLRSFAPNERDEYMRDVDRIKKHLIRAAEIRNIIAHAKWPSITSDGYVFSAVEAITSSQAVPEFRYYKLDMTALENSRAYIGAVANMPYYIATTYFDL